MVIGINKIKSQPKLFLNLGKQRGNQNRIWKRIANEIEMTNKYYEIQPSFSMIPFFKTFSENVKQILTYL